LLNIHTHISSYPTYALLTYHSNLLELCRCFYFCLLRTDLLFLDGAYIMIEVFKDFVCFIPLDAYFLCSNTLITLHVTRLSVNLYSPLFVLSFDAYLYGVFQRLFVRFFGIWGCCDISIKEALEMLLNLAF